MAGAFDCGTAPENFVGKLHELRPQVVFFMDAVDFGAAAGTVRLMAPGELACPAVSTHAAGLTPLVRYIASACRADCCVLAIQPRDTRMGAPLSDAVERAVAQIIRSGVWRARGG